MQEREFLVALSTFAPFGPKRTTLLINYFKSAKKVWNASKKELLETGLGIALTDGFLSHKSHFNAEDYFRKLNTENIKAVTKTEKSYPVNLKDLDSAPHVLYVKGNLKASDSRSIAIVGTRMMTAYGREVAERFAGSLASLGITVVSGLALGIDACAQRAAMEAGGRTVSVLASGLNIISPVSNISLALSFIKKGGALVSEYPLGHEPRPFDFPVRDRLIAGMAKGVIVVEGRMKSGTFYTVRAALELGRPVFAVPGPITSPASEAPNYLIQNGAKPVTQIRDVLDELDMQFKADTEAVNKVMPATETEALLSRILDREPLHLDEVVRISGITTAEVSARLTIMEMRGLVKSMGDGLYKRI